MTPRKAKPGPVNFHDAVVPLLVDIDSVSEWPDNPRSGDLEVLKESIRKNGFYAPIVVQRETNYVIAGNHRHQALREMGSTQVPVLFMDIDDIEATRMALADNRTSDLAFYNDEQLFALLDHLVQTEGLEGSGYDRAAYELLLQQAENNDIVGGIRQGLTPDDRIDQYNQLDIRSIILPYEAAVYEKVATDLARLRRVWELDTNAEVVKQLLDNAISDLGDEPALSVVEG
jgi:hypothetical protein